MEIGIAKYSREVVRMELAGRTLADLLRLKTIVGVEAAHRVLGLPIPAMPSYVEVSLGSSSFDLDINDINVDQLYIGRVVMAMYGYAYEQRYPVGVPMYQLKAELEQVEDFALHLKSELIDLFMSDPVHMREANAAEWRALPDLYAMTAARLRLDMGEDLEIPEVALLANMAEKSVRNSVNATGEAQLRVLSIASTEWVDNDEARRWLSQRRGFIPTHFEDMTAEARHHPESLSSLYELGSYIHKRWVALGKSPKLVHEELDWHQSRFDYLNAIAASPQKIDPKDCSDLARSLLVSESWFTTQVMRNLFPNQVELLFQREQHVELAPRNLKTVAGNERTCTRLRFVLHNGTELFPIRMKNRESGKVAFRLSKGGAGGNTKGAEHAKEVEDENEMINLVCQEGMAIRLVSADGSRQGLYIKGGRSVSHVELDGEII